MSQHPIRKDNTLPQTNQNSTELESNLGETIERLLGILTRRRWWILSVGCVVPIAVIAVAMKLPDHYVSQATLLVVQQQVSQRYVESDSTTTLAAAVQAMKFEVLSRTRLLSIINDFGLYRALKERSAPDALADIMRQDVDIQPLEVIPGRDFNAFTISFTAATPQLAQAVTSRLTALFIEQNQKTQGEQAANTEKFLSDQLDAAKRRLSAQDQRLQAFRANNMGELPEQQQTNQAALTDARMRLEAIESSISLAQQQQSSLELSLEERLVQLQSEKAELLKHYTPRYPGVVKKDQDIARVQSALDRLKTNTASASAQAQEATDDPSLDLILRQAESNMAQMANLLKQQERLKQESEQYQNRINVTPLREQQLAAISRDEDIFKQDYANLEKQTLQSEMTASLEENQEGQQFRLVDSPSLPVKPSSPKRLKIALGGLGGGIGLGLALALLLDLRDTSFHNEKTLNRNYAVPFVLGVPLARTVGERRLRRLRIVLECLAGFLMTIAVCAAEFYVYKVG